ncbi:hypothetical protein [Allokutzneria sp. NRRL B-24872]|uniref:hypothetical protein n=1 Tax=Allokutzneria sp. NRRL B-24872 TaxID=1137961 RepID=UPI00143CFEA0|nr:hypothetical protein [Allokutzneria sp. NRRL B-24872]
MLGIIATLLIIWLALTIIGFIFKGLFWLAVIGGIAFLATAAYGAVKKKSPKY